MKALRYLVLLLALCGGSAACANGGRVTIPASEMHKMESSGTGHEYRLHVALPRIPVNDRTPVLFMLDANAHFAMAVDLVRAMAAAGELPDFLIVGIGYPVERVDETIIPRLRDYSPVADPPHEELVTSMLGRPVRSGDAPDFLRFILDEVKPFIARRYGAKMDNSIFYGHSLGGLFGLYALFEAPQSFAAYIIGSPPVLWGEEYLTRAEASYAARHQDLPARVYIAAGEDESDLARVLNLPDTFERLEREFIQSLGNPNPLTQLKAFVEALRNRGYRSLDLSLTIFPQETHSTVPAPLLTHSLRALWAPQSVDDKAAREK